MAQRWSNHWSPKCIFRRLYQVFFKIKSAGQVNNQDIFQVECIDCAAQNLYIGTSDW